MTRKPPSVKAHAQPATGTGSAGDAEPWATYTTPATEQAQHQLGRRLAPPNKEAIVQRVADADALGVRARQLRDQEQLPVKQVGHRLAEELGVEETDSFRRKVYRWLKRTRAE